MLCTFANFHFQKVAYSTEMYTRFACLFPHLRLFKTGSYFEDQPGLELTFVLPQPPKCWHYSKYSGPPCMHSEHLAGARDECSCWALGSPGRAEVFPMLLTMLIWTYYALSTLPLAPIVQTNLAFYTKMCGEIGRWSCGTFVKHCAGSRWWPGETVFGSWFSLLSSSHCHLPGPV